MNMMKILVVMEYKYCYLGVLFSLQDHEYSLSLTQFSRL